jgi:hypothetical protein
VMVHPSDSEIWKTLDIFDIDFIRKARNVRIWLATDGFTPYNSSATSVGGHKMSISYANMSSICKK